MVVVLYVTAMVWLYLATSEYLKKCRVERVRVCDPEPLIQNFLFSYISSSVLSLLWLFLIKWFSATVYTVDSIVSFFIYFFLSTFVVMMTYYIFLIKWLDKKKG